MKTIAKQIKWDFEANGYLEIKDKNGNQIYYENSDEYWSKWEYDSKGNIIYFEDSYGYWRKWERDSQGKLIYYEDSTGRWDKHKYDSKGNEIYLETSRGVIIDNRAKPCENIVVEIEGVKYKLTKV